MVGTLAALRGLAVDRCADATDRALRRTARGAVMRLLVQWFQGFDGPRRGRRPTCWPSGHGHGGPAFDVQDARLPTAVSREPSGCRSECLLPAAGARDGPAASPCRRVRRLARHCLTTDTGTVVPARGQSGRAPVTHCALSRRSGEMADAPDSKSGSGNRVRVQVPPPALTRSAADAGLERSSICWGPAGGQKGRSNRARDSCQRHAAARLTRRASKRPAAPSPEVATSSSIHDVIDDDGVANVRLECVQRRSTCPGR